jgi:hypothetical protein
MVCGLWCLHRVVSSFGAGSLCCMHAARVFSAGDGRRINDDFNGTFVYCISSHGHQSVRKRAVHISGKTRILQLFAAAARSHKAILRLSSRNVRSSSISDSAYGRRKTRRSPTVPHFARFTPCQPFEPNSILITNFLAKLAPTQRGLLRGVSQELSLSSSEMQQGTALVYVLFERSRPWL